MNRPPSFLDVPEDIEVIHGDKYQLYCKTTGKPQPEITWFRDDEEIESSDSTLVTSKHTDLDYGTEGNIKLKKVTSFHQGTYRIEARNSVGEAFHQFNFEGRDMGFKFVIIQ